MSVRLPYDPRAARTARKLVDELLVAHGADDELRQDAALVVHELVMNSVVHGSPDQDGEIELAWRLVGSQLEISVLDCGSGGTVEVRHPDDEAPNGRGLAIVAALSTSWSVDRSTGTRVTARLALA
jgi:anti-sigma regulatory factor (Ser/Thr protein kinase)